MNKKLTGLLITGLLTLALATPLVVSAANNDGMENCHRGKSAVFSQMTQDQRQELSTELQPYRYQLLEIKSQMYQKFVEHGILTQEQVDTRINQMKTNIENPQRHQGHHDFKQNRGQFTPEQKEKIQAINSELKPYQYQMLEVRKQMLQKLVERNIITQEQADNRIATMKDKIDNGKMGEGHQGRGPHSMNCQMNR